MDAVGGNALLKGVPDIVIRECGRGDEKERGGEKDVAHICFYVVH